VLDVPRAAAVGVHDLHRRRARGRLHRAHKRGHPPTLRPTAPDLVSRSPPPSSRTRRPQH
jgi:hypothetical protein